jgi:hypothetical protein
VDGGVEPIPSRFEGGDALEERFPLPRQRVTGAVKYLV